MTKKLKGLFGILCAGCLMAGVCASSLGYAQGNAGDPAGTKLDASLRLAFQLWHDTIRLQGT